MSENPMLDAVNKQIAINQLKLAVDEEQKKLRDSIRSLQLGLRDLVGKTVEYARGGEGSRVLLIRTTEGTFYRAEYDHEDGLIDWPIPSYEELVNAGVLTEENLKPLHEAQAAYAATQVGDKVATEVHRLVRQFGKDALREKLKDVLGD